jgi:hypothetical protein
MSIVAHPHWTLCHRCDSNVATTNYLGGTLCVECVNELKAQRTCAAAAELMTRENDAPPGPTLDELLARLVNS